MAALYKQFLASPSSSLLAEDASLHYIPTTTSIKGSAEIIKHLSSLSKQLRKTKEEILNAVDGQINAAFEVDTGLEFLTSGGPYLSVINLPKLDDNLICDRTVYLPIHHFVNLGADGKINQIRLSWDQGALLKQIEAIGRSGINWPIKDNREQLALIQSCLKSAGAGPSAANQDQKELLIRNRGSSTNALRDPHASLHLQPTREELEEMERSSVTAPYGGTKLQQRGFADILGDDPAGEHYDDRDAMSPAKAGGGKNYQPMRIFDGQEDVPEDEDTPKGRPASAYIKPNPNKYKHFDFSDGSDPADAAHQPPQHKGRPKSTHNSQWSFDDFTTPSKPNTKKPVRAQEARHWDTDRDALGEETPAPQQSKGRRDAEAHFELQDDGEQVPVNTRHHQKGSMQNENLGLYKNKLFDQDEQGDEEPRALGNITNLKGRGQTFGAHWEMTDESPAHQAPQRQPIPQARQKAVKMMDANWSSYDESPKQKENERLSEQKADTGINIAGDGMGGRKGTTRDWMFGGNDAEEEAPKPAATKGRGGLTNKQRDFWDF